MSIRNNARLISVLVGVATVVVACAAWLWPAPLGSSTVADVQGNTEVAETPRQLSEVKPVTGSVSRKSSLVSVVVTDLSEVPLDQEVCLVGPDPLHRVLLGPDGCTMVPQEWEFVSVQIRINNKWKNLVVVELIPAVDGKVRVRLAPSLWS